MARIIQSKEARIIVKDGLDSNFKVGYNYTVKRG